MKTPIKFEDAVKTILTDDKLNDALEFISFLQENKMNPINTSKNGWKISSKACVVSYIWLDSDAGTLTVLPFIGEYKHDSLSDDLKEIVWAKKTQGSSCGGCHHCSYKIKTIFGKEYTDACARSILFVNPNFNELECIKKLLELRKHTIKNGTRLPALPTNFA